MKSNSGTGRSAFELVEEAVHLLRSGSAAALASYYIGALPFVLGSLYFWTDMSRSAFAEQHLAEAALGVGLLFLWMKCWQAVFARRLLAQLEGGATPSTPGGFRGFVAQAAIQPTGLLVVPLASIPLLPFAWVYAFYQNATVLGFSEPGGTRDLVKRAARQCAMWPKQNHALLSLLLGFAVVVFLNWMTVVLLLPLMLKTFLGLQTTFSRSPLAMLNTTFFAVVAALTYLSVDPLAKAAYALRCFYGQAVHSGVDLAAQLQRLKAEAAAAACVAMLLVAGTAGAQTVQTEQTPGGVAGAPPVVQEISPEKLDRAITDTLQERKYAWRAPRERLVRNDTREGILSRFLNQAADTLKHWFSSAADWVGRVLRKLFGQQPQLGPQPSGFGWMSRLHLLIYLLVAAAVIGITLLIRHLVRSRRAKDAPVIAQPVQPAVDVADENVAPDQLPLDEWTRLAQELLARGEFRLALRAMYLGSLARLAERNLVTIARFKSNRDYERELRRRAHSWPELLERFSENVSIINRTWYGTHPAQEELIRVFSSNLDAMRVDPAPP